MKRTKFQRITAFALTFVLLLGGSITSVGAADAQNNESVTDVTIESMRDLLGAVAYDDYCDGYYEKDDEGKVITDEKTGKPIWTVDKATEDVIIDCLDYDKENTDAAVEIKEVGGKTGLLLPDSGSATWKVTVPADGRYTIVVEYYPIEAKNTSIGRILKINGSIPFSEARYLNFSKVYANVYDESAKNTLTDKSGSYDRYFNRDIYGNELRATAQQKPEWREYTFKDSDGFTTDPFELVFKKGENTITLQAESEPMVIKSIKLCAPKENQSYDDYSKGYEGKPAGTDKIIIQAEEPAAISSQTIYAVEDRTSPVTRPSSTKVQLLNTIGGEKWQVAGQWVRYEFTVSESGMYEIATRFRQNINDGMYSARILYVYSNGLAEGADGYYDGIPFKEATQLSFGYSDEWQSDVLHFIDENGEKQNLELYFEKGVTYYVEFEVTLGDMGEIVSRVQKSLETINQAYLDIIKLTGTSPDEYRNYGFYRVMPETMIQMVIQSWELHRVAELLYGITGEKGSNYATLEKVSQLLNEMGTDEDEVARNLDRLKSYIGTLGTWISDAKTQPLQLDYLQIQGAGLAEADPKKNLPDDTGSFWQQLIHELGSFWQSFFRDYNHMGAIVENVSDEETVEVWLAYGRDQSQVIRNLINNYFTPQTGITVDLKLVAGGTLLPSILAGSGPDTYIGIGQSDVINYAIRGALLNIEHLDGYTEIDPQVNPDTSPFNDAAMEVLRIEDSQGIQHCYGVPETQNFEMMFVRTDILADLDLEIPKTWDDVLEALPKLQANNMEIGLTTEYNIYLYQAGGELFADNGMRINLDSNVGLDAFATMCDMFTMYSFPYEYNFSNRFRTGEMPIGIGNYTTVYNTLVVFATEIRGLWQFFPLPGTMDENGNIDNTSVSSVTAICMIHGCDNVEDTWEFMKWQVGDDCQARYANEMVAILGDSAKHPTANRFALDQLTWTQSELTEIKKQFLTIEAVPNYPGAYIVGRYTNFAFLAAYNDMADPSNELLTYINIINDEITRKRAEFGLETLAVGDTLAQKRLKQALISMADALGTEIEGPTKDNDYAVQSSRDMENFRESLTECFNSSSDKDGLMKVFEAAMAVVEGTPKSGVSDDVIEALEEAIETLKAIDASKYSEAVSFIEVAITALHSYNIEK